MGFAFISGFAFIHTLMRIGFPPLFSRFDCFFTAWFLPTLPDREKFKVIATFETDTNKANRSQSAAYSVLFLLISFGFFVKTDLVISPKFGFTF